MIELLRKLSHNGNDIHDLISAVDYHKRTAKDDVRQTAGDAQYDCQYTNGRKSMQTMPMVKLESGTNETGDLVVRYSGPGTDGVVTWPFTVTLAQTDWERGGKVSFGVQKRSSVEFHHQYNPRAHFQRSYSQPMSVYNNFNYPNAAPSRNIRRNLSTTNAQRTPHQPTPTQTRSESVLHR